MAGIASDRLYPLAQQEELARHIPSSRGVDVVESEVGHDGFLLETEQVGEVIAAALG